MWLMSPMRAYGRITNAADVQRDSLSNPNHKSPPVVVMEKLVDQQNILRKLIDEGKQSTKVPKTQAAPL